MAYIRGVERRCPMALIAKLVNGLLNYLVAAFFEGAAPQKEA